MPDERVLAKLLHPDFLDKDLLESAAHNYDTYLCGEDIRQGAILLDLENPLIYNQLSRIDKLTMAHSVEARVPFLDRAFAEMAYSVPFTMKVHRGIHKYILRAAMKGYLPDKVIKRPKRGRKGTQALMPSLSELFLSSDKGEMLSRESTERRGWFRFESIRNYLNQANSLHVKLHPIEKRRRQKFILALVSLELWARIFLDHFEA